MAQVCSFFQQGCCRFGDRCRNSHALVVSASEQALRQEEERLSLDKDCGICCDKVSGNFGLLECNCVFCLSCIKEWRLKGKDIADKATVRLCPLCRKESLDVIPSKYHITRPERKQEVVESYRAVRANIPCKFFNPSCLWSCPFGPACVYAHRLEDGSPAPVVDRPAAIPSRRTVPRPSRSNRHPTARRLRLPSRDTSIQDLRAYFESVVRDVLVESGATNEAAEQLIRAVIIDVFSEEYGHDRTFEIISA